MFVIDIYKFMFVQKPLQQCQLPIVGQRRPHILQSLTSLEIATQRFLRHTDLGGYSRLLHIHGLFVQPEYS